MIESYTLGEIAGSAKVKRLRFATTWPVSHAPCTIAQRFRCRRRLTCWICDAEYLRESGSSLLICGPCYSALQVRRNDAAANRDAGIRYRERRADAEAAEGPFSL